MSKVSMRDARVRVLISSLFDQAAASPPAPLDGATEGELKALFLANAYGFREVLLVAVMGKLIDSRYDPSTNFYGCSPRALYEGPIRAELENRQVPHGKSGPLNVAKAAKVLDKSWAAQKEPRGAAYALVSLLEKVNQMNATRLREFTIRVLALFLDKASQMKKYKLPDLNSVKDDTKKLEAVLELIRLAPDGGNTPQRVCGLILDSYHRCIGSEVKIDGLEDEACVTTTTSKKAADISEATLTGAVLNAYEVTVKVIDMNRIKDWWEAVMDYNSDRGSSHPISEVTFLCRPQDVEPMCKPSPGMIMGVAEYKGLLIKFINLEEWIRFMLMVAMPHEARASFIGELNKYVDNHNRSELVKRSWKEILERER